MNSWQRWIKAPQTHLARRVLFQVHLWLGIGLGLYVLAISISGSALLLRSPFYGWFEPKTVEPTDAAPLTGDALNARMAEVYAGYELGFTIEGYEPTSATYIVLGKDGEFFPHYFNQYTGEDIGVANPWPIKTVEWLANIHDDLLMDRTGRQINGIGGLLFVLMSFSGLLIWWQGRARWHEGLMIRRNSSRKFMWQLHSFIGFWSLLLMLAWGVSGFQLGFPQFMNTVVDWFDSDLTDFERPDSVLRFFRTVHFARIGEGMFANWAWTLISFLPSLMFITGLILWWRRVVRGGRKSGTLVEKSVDESASTLASAQ
jgi:uncharacterized iron-regulated membrane protein